MNMAGTDRRRLVCLAALFLGAVALNGCMFVNAHFTVQHDGSTDAAVEIGILKAALEGEEGGAETTLGEALEEGRWQKPEEFDRGQYRVTAVKGHAGPGESLFKPGTPDVPSFGRETHLLTTVYSFTMPLHVQPPTPQEGPEAQQPPAAGGDDQRMQEMFGALAALMSAQDQNLRFACTLPGEIASSNGTQVAPDTVAWALNLSGAGLPEGGELRATSRLINWRVVGEVGDALMRRGREDLVLPLVAGAQRGIIPDPITANPAAQAVDLELYTQILEVMVALDGLVGKELTDQIMVALKLNVDRPDPQALAVIAAKVASPAFAEAVSRAAVDNVVWKLLEP